LITVPLAAGESKTLLDISGKMGLMRAKSQSTIALKPNRAVPSKPPLPAGNTTRWSAREELLIRSGILTMKPGEVHSGVAGNPQSKKLLSTGTSNWP
jgi:hypothetical protein